MTDYAKAVPRKRFFIEMFTRDIALEDCTLDLIDNSIDALFRTGKIKYSKDVASLLQARNMKSAIPEINISYGDKTFIVEDNCGGIPLSLAKENVFNFGHDEKHKHYGTLGAYGIGLKRAIFKIGNLFSISSRTTKDGFEVCQSISKWVKNDSSFDDWRFEIKTIAAAKNDRQAGTKVEINELYNEVLMRLSDGSFEANLRNLISTTYTLFLEKDLRIKVNGKVVKPYSIPLGESTLVTPSHFKKKYNKVNVQLLASLAERDRATKDWKAEKAGWYVFCNGRMVVGCDKTGLTGWGTALLPSWHSKYRGFIGLAFFTSDDPLELPWTTTKRDINRESDIFQQARIEMQTTARPIVSFLNKMYPTEEQGKREERRIAKSVKTADLSKLVKKKETHFMAKISEVKKTATKKISYEVNNEDLKSVKKALGHPKWKPNQVGEYTFNYFMKRECTE